MSELAPSRKRPLDELEREDVSEPSTSKLQKSDTCAGEQQGSEDVQMKDSTTPKADEPHSDGGNSDSEQHSESSERIQQQKKAKKTESGRARRKKKKGDQDESEGPKKRQPRMRRRATKEEEDAAKERKAQAEALGIPSAPRYPKRQSALLIGFCGSGYSGMQIQPDNIKTIEGVLFKALVNAGAVSQDNADDPVKVSLARAARTDAGVHAAGNVVSLKMIITVPGVKDLVARINEELPPEIRLWGFVRAQNSFNARLVCDSRKYTYYFPSYLLIPPKPGSGLYDKLRGKEASTETSEVESSPVHPFWQESATGSHEEDLARKRAWRVGPAEMERLRKFVKKYEASHNFHNFTVGREFGDRSNVRFMKEIRVEDPVVHGDTEWISVLFHGQSFMLHQIRKMMAALVLTCRIGSSPEIVDELYKAPMVFIPKMPSLGLLLEEPLFNSYNGRMTVHNQNYKPTDADYRPLIDFDLHREKIDAFKEEFIYKNMRGIEDRSGLFDAWVRSVDKYSGDDLLWLNREGKVPQECVIIKGKWRSNPFREKRVFDTTSFPSTAIVKKQLLEEAEAAEEDEEEEVLDKKHLAETEG
ncbi:hypothetical protein H1R20_g2270, partial [Candolleomyces eurysporus]